MYKKLLVLLKIRSMDGKFIFMGAPDNKYADLPLSQIVIEIISI